jgi:hypothetical protein
MINVRKIKEMEEAKKKIRKEIYTKIFEQFGRKIQVAVNAKQKQTFLEVPSFLLGYPVYDVDMAVLYLKRQLLLSGFQVVHVPPTVFNVSWYTEKEKSKEPPPQFVYDPVPPSFSDDQFPSLINLKKAAKRYA